MTRAVLYIAVVLVITAFPATSAAQTPATQDKGSDQAFQKQWNEVREKYPLVAAAYRLHTTLAYRLAIQCSEDPFRAARCAKLRAVGSPVVDLFCPERSVSFPPIDGCLLAYIACSEKAMFAPDDVPAGEKCDDEYTSCKSRLRTQRP